MKFKDKAIVKEMAPMLTIREVAHLLHVHTNTVRRWSDCGMMRAYRISQRGDRRFKQDDIAHFLFQLEAHRGEPKEIDMVWK